ncbi:MipA/OmpV family protein [Paracoccus sp. (in: a-proteobacteria)]|uniref:MipA/OmpV family protein n=1 Tax=Paracoccus sp. TaxID=267 RepID=UPI0032204DEB
MTRTLALALISALVLALPAAAQTSSPFGGFSVDAGVGASFSPEYMGAEDHDASPWLILRNGDSDRDLKDGFSISPSGNVIGKRDADDFDLLRGMEDIGYAGELGARLSWRAGPTTSYGTLRKGFGGHSGVVGEVGAKYRFEYNDRLTFWTGAELGLGDDEFTGTYFGVTGEESRASGLRAHDPDGGAYIARFNVEARYEFMPDTAIMGRISYGRLLGDAGDSPVVESRDQPSVSIGLTRRLNFRF